MRKTIILAMAMSALCVSAQVMLPNFPNGDRNTGVDAFTLPRMWTGRTMPTVEVEVPALVVTTSGVTPRRMANATDQATNTLSVGYKNPKGTLFLGMDEEGKGTWFNKGGIVGAWSDSINHWTYEQVVEGQFDSIEYTNYALKKFASYFEAENYFYKDKSHNWCDSVVSDGGFAESYDMGIFGDNTQYPWTQNMPLQSVFRKDTTESFMLLSQSAKPKATDGGFTVGGLPSGNSADGLWPLTNAVNISREGISIALEATTDEDGYTHYIFGTDSLNIDTIDGEPLSYVRMAPTKIVTRYDCPQAPLYVKSITVMLGAKGNSQLKNNIQFNELIVNVFDKDSQLIATSAATKDNMRKMSYKTTLTGRLLTFSFLRQNEYGEKLEEGFVVKDAFFVEISGLENANFGIYSAKSTLHASQSYVEYSDGDTTILAGQNYDPYIMLNGIFNTFENYAQTGIYKNLVNMENRGDTIPINMVKVTSPYYQYRGFYAAKDLSQANTFEYYSTFAPYDSITRYWTMDVRKPDYIELGSDYDTNYGTEDNPISLWDIARLFDIYIYATSTPKIGDLISVGKCGRQVVFEIQAIDGATPLEETTEDSLPTGVTKYMDRDGRFCIRKGNALFNIQGQIINQY